MSDEEPMFLGRTHYEWILLLVKGLCIGWVIFVCVALLWGSAQIFCIFLPGICPSQVPTP